MGGGEAGAGGFAAMDKAIVQRVAGAVMDDIRDGTGNRVAGLLDGAVREVIRRGDGGRLSLARKVVEHRVDLAGVRMTVGECAVLWQRLPALRAMLDDRIGSPQQLAVMGRLAARQGWNEGLQAIFSSGRHDWRHAFWRDRALEASVRHADTFGLILAQTRFVEGVRNLEFFSTFNESLNVLLAMAGSGQPERLWRLAEEKAPGLCEDVGNILHWVGGGRASVFAALTTAAQAENFDDAGWTFLARRVCSTDADRVALAVMMAGHDADDTRLVRVCQEEAGMAQAVARAAGTRRGALRFIDAMVRHVDFDSQEQSLLRRVASVAGLAGRTAALGDGVDGDRSRDKRHAEALASWVAARQKAALETCRGRGRRRRA